LKIIRGNVSELGNILQGAGFTVAVGANTNTYIITFDTPFSDLPSVTFTPGDTSALTDDNIVNIVSLTNTQVTIYTMDGTDTVVEPTWFSFIAIGPR
jgi:hypothetical protein